MSYKIFLLFYRNCKDTTKIRLAKSFGVWLARKLPGEN